MKGIYLTILSLFLLLQLSACGKNSDGGGAEISGQTESLPSSPEDTEEEEVVAEEPLPEEPTPDALAADSDGVKEDLSNPGVRYVGIRASRSYKPKKWQNGWYFVKKESKMIIPPELHVVEGRAGNHLAFVRLTTQNQKPLRCVYVGQGPNTKKEFEEKQLPYIFDFCVSDEEVKITRWNRKKIKGSHYNILDTEERNKIGFHLLRGDKIEVHVRKGNRKSSKKIPTVVEYRLDIFE